MDMGQPSVFGAALSWIVAALTGSIAVSLAVIAVALLGLSLLRGHVDMQRAVRVVIGCFLIFGAHAVAAGFMGLAGHHVLAHDEPSEPKIAAPPSPPPMPIAPPPSAPSGYDPYAGASVPHH